LTGGTITTSGTCLINNNSNLHATVINVHFDGGGSAIASGTYYGPTVDYACTISRASLVADQSGTISIDLWAQLTASWGPPTASQKISASDPIAVSSAASEIDTTLTGWSPIIAAHTSFAWHIGSNATSITQADVALECDKS
jgi:hypothetical protein